MRKIRKKRALMLILGMILVVLTVFVIKKVKMPFSFSLTPQFLQYAGF